MATSYHTMLNRLAMRSHEEETAPSVGRVRALESTDLDAIVRLYQCAMAANGSVSPSTLRARLARVMLRNPWRDAALPSLVYQDRNGEVVGCVGVLPRPMLFEGKWMAAAISHSFIVSRDNRASLAALALAKRFFAGQQDLSLAEGNEPSRIIWERGGGSALHLYSLCWTRPLRPGRYALAFLGKRGLPSALGKLLRPAGRLADALAPRLAHRLFDIAPSVLSSTPLDGESLHRLIIDCTQQRSLRPVYDACTLEWLLESLAQRNERGLLEKVVARDGNGEPVGWYLYYANPGEVAVVVQLGARAGFAEEVLAQLFFHARRSGAVAVSGQVDPGLFPAYSRSNCVFHHDGGSWVLMHSRHAALQQAIERGDAFLTRLEGEWWIGSLLNPV